MGRPVQVVIGVAAAIVALIVVGALFLGGDDDESSATTDAPVTSATTTPTTRAPTTTAGAPATSAPTTAPATIATRPTTTPGTTTSTAATTPTTTTMPPQPAPWLGTWELTEETRLPAGAPPAAPGVDYFVILTLTDGAFHSAYSDTFGQACDWEGSSTAAGEGTLAWADISSAVFPCSQAEGISSLVTWTMPDSDTLILDMADLPGGTLQTYTRTEAGA